MPLSEHQWEIASPDGSVDLVFGTTDTGIQTAHEPDLGERKVANNDVPLPREDGIAFGPDYDQGTTITFEANVLTESHRDQSDLLNRLRGVWSNRAFRKDSEAHAILKACVAGRVRRCYGRPRRFAEVDLDLTAHGYTGALFDFATIDGKFYDDSEQVVSVGLIPASSGGFTDPITDPITDQVNVVTPPGQVVVTGQETWLVATFHGPVTNPVADFGDFEIGIDGAIAAGESVTVDPRPWSRGVYRSDGGSVAGTLTYATPPLREIRLLPGTHYARYGGTDNTGTSVLELAWRNAHDRP